MVLPTPKYCNFVYLWNRYNSWWQKPVDCRGIKGWFFVQLVSVWLFHFKLFSLSNIFNWMAFLYRVTSGNESIWCSQCTSHNTTLLPENVWWSPPKDWNNISSVSFDAAVYRRGLAWCHYKCTWYMSCNQYCTVRSCFANGLACLKRKTPFALRYHIECLYTIHFDILNMSQNSSGTYCTPFRQRSTAKTCAVFADFCQSTTFSFRPTCFGLQRCWFVFTTRPSLYLFYIWFHNLDSFRFVECLLILNDVEANKPICYFKCKYFTVWVLPAFSQADIVVKWDFFQRIFFFLFCLVCPFESI